MTGHPSRTSIAFAALLVLSVAAPPVTAADNSDESFFDGLVDDETTVGIGQWVATTVTDATSWAARKHASITSDETENATQYANAFEQEFNSENETIEDYASTRLTASTDYDVFRIYFHDREDGNVTRYLVSDVENGTWQNTRVVSELPADRQTDHYISLDWYQSKHAADELDAFVDDYARPNENLTAGYRASMLAKYGAPESDMWGTNESDGGND